LDGENPDGRICARYVAICSDCPGFLPLEQSEWQKRLAKSQVKLGAYIAFFFVDNLASAGTPARQFTDLDDLHFLACFALGLSSYFMAAVSPCAGRNQSLLRGGMDPFLQF
jgi:hypothetical protein